MEGAIAYATASSTTDTNGEHPAPLPKAILEGAEYYRTRLPVGYERICECKGNHINCLTAKEWLKSQLGVWQFNYEKRDIRDKKLHPATFPLSLSRKVIELFSHEGEMVLDPFVGSGTVLVAAQDTNRNAVGFDLSREYVTLSEERLMQKGLFQSVEQVAIQDDARNIHQYLDDESVSLIWTSPPYSNLLNRKRRNKSRRDRKNDQLGKVEQYSQDPARSGNDAAGRLHGGDGGHIRVAAAASETQRALRYQRAGYVVGESANHDSRLTDRGTAQEGI